MKFGRLHDTRFPNLDNVDVYSYKNEFDYTRWTAGTKIKLCNVLWNADYSDVAKFETNIERDRWFDNLQDYYTIELDSDRSYVPEQSIKIPVPYDIAARYNYMVITIPVLPGTEPPINYEDPEIGIRRWYFFIDSIDYKAANTTACRLSLDVWTQYQNDVEIKYLMLERGHAPIAKSDVDKYLDNPIANNDYILAPDITPSDAQVVKANNFIPFGNGVKYVCFASTCPASQITKMGAVIHNDSDYTFGTLTYSDINARYGYQLKVNGFKVGNGDNYSGLNTKNNPLGRTNDLIPNGSYMYAIEASSAQAFITKVMDNCPVFFRTVLACFMVDADMLTFGTSISFQGYTLRECMGNNQQVDIKLTKDMFGFPEEYKHLAKLYTFPYSSIELTDNVGNTVNVRIENTGHISAHKESMLAYPFLNARIWFDGINGSGSNNYMWIDMNGTSLQKEMPNSDWSKACFDLNIPCYAIYMDSETAWYLDNFYTAIRGNGKRALASYHDAVRSANTARANAIDSNNTMYSNQDSDATTLVTNTGNTTSCNRSNTDISIATNTQVCNLNNQAGADCTLYSNTAAKQKTLWSNTATSATVLEENLTTVATTKNSASTSLMSTTTAGAMAGGMLGMGAGPIGAMAGFVGGGVTGLLSGAMSYGTAMDNAAITCQANSNTAQQVREVNVKTTGESTDCATLITTRQNDCSTAVSAAQNSAMSRHTNNSNATMTANSANSAATMRANANRTRNTGNANAGYTREISILNAKENLEATQLGSQYALNAAKMGAPIAITPESGNYLPWYDGNNGVQVKVKTMANSYVRQIGDTFMRYGYALNQVWNIDETGLCPMPHFCYWKAGDIWVDDRKSSNNLVQEIMMNIFMRGVTVWKNPDEIGKVSIYANR